MTETNIKRKPLWLKRKLPQGPQYEAVKKLVKDAGVHTVCAEAKCPNKFECFSKRTATFMILGDRCTRSCNFCAVKNNPLSPPDPEEPVKVAKSVLEMGLVYAVITSVTRDDLEDGGARHFAKTVHEIKQINPAISVEVLIPDFKGNQNSLIIILDTKPDVLNHNIETVERLYEKICPEASYSISMELLKRSKEYSPEIPTKSGIMLGLGETQKEIIKTLEDLRKVSCDILTLGQYLQPTTEHLPVERFVTPDEFEELRQLACSIGFSQVASGPLVRSSYNAAELNNEL